MIETPKVHYDRLSALISRFALKVSVCAVGAGNMRLRAKAGSKQPHLIEFAAQDGKFSDTPDDLLVEAHVDFGGDANPLMAVLPGLLRVSVTDEETILLLRVFLAEAEARRCGSGTALNRLAEVLVIRILRTQLEKGTATPGVLAGLSDPKISRAIVAMHETPGRSWRNRDLAAIAGMSISRFADVFRTKMGEPPQAYLRRWRMTLARQDMEIGERVSSVARRYGYASPEALTHSFRRYFGHSPMAFRPSKSAVISPR